MLLPSQSSTLVASSLLCLFCRIASSANTTSRQGLDLPFRSSSWPPAPFTFTIPVRQRAFHKLHVLSYDPSSLSRQEILSFALIHAAAAENLRHHDPDDLLPPHEMVLRPSSGHHETFNPNRINLEVSFLNQEFEYGRSYTLYTAFKVLDMLVFLFLDNHHPVWEGHYAELVPEMVGIGYKRVLVRRRFEEHGGILNVPVNGTVDEV